MMLTFSFSYVLVFTAGAWAGSMAMAFYAMHVIKEKEESR